MGIWRRDEWPIVNAIFCFDLFSNLAQDGDAIYPSTLAAGGDKGLKHHLAGIAAKYRQDTIAFALCEPELIESVKCGAYDRSLVLAWEELDRPLDTVPRCTLPAGHDSGWHGTLDADGKLVAEWRGPHNAEEPMREPSPS